MKESRIFCLVRLPIILTNYSLSRILASLCSDLTDLFNESINTQHSQTMERRHGGRGGDLCQALDDHRGRVVEWA
jgi:hypothetical protein